MFQNVFQHIKKYCNKRNILFILLVSVFALSFYDIGFAADGGESQINAKTGQEFPSNQSAAGATTEAVSTAMRGVGSVLALLTSLVTLFMHPGWYTGEIFDINVYLKEIWILVSNVVYFIFAILLVWVALMNIIGKGGDYELKKQLPKFIVGILIVPFSWFIVQFLVSLAAVLTAAVLSLPYDTFKNYEAMAKFQTEMKIPAKCVINLGGSPSGSTSNSGGGKQAGGGAAINCEEGGTITMQELFDGSGGGKKPGEKSVFGIMQIYTYGILKFEDIDKVSLKDVTSLSGIKNLTNLSLKAIMNLFFVVVYLILLFALFLALFVRGIQIWIYMMISPLFGLFYYFGGSIGKLGKLSEFNLKHFIELAMMPVYVAAALSFGLLFIAVVDNGMTKAGGNSVLLKCTGGGGSNQTCSITLGGFELAIKGAVGDSSSESPNRSNPVGYLIMQLFAIVVLWVSVMAALKTSTLTKSVVEPFESFGNHVGGVIQKLPQYTPIPFTGGLTASGLKDLSGKLTNTIEQTSSDRTRDWANKNNMSWLYSGSNDTAEKILREIKSGNVNSGVQKSEKLKEILPTIDFSRIKSSEAEVLKHFGIDTSGKSAEQVKEQIRRTNSTGSQWVRIDNIDQLLDAKNTTPPTTPTQTPPVTSTGAGLIKKEGDKIIFNNNSPINIDQNFNSTGQFTEQLKANASKVFKDEADLRTSLQRVLNGTEPEKKRVIDGIIGSIKSSDNFYK